MSRTDSCEPHHQADTHAELEMRARGLHDPEAITRVADTFRLLGDPTRVRILDALAPGELCVCDLAALLGLTQSAVSHQLRLLRGVRMVRPRRAGRQIFYTLDDKHVISLFRQALTHVQEDGGTP